MRERLIRYIDAKRNEQFAWGVHDCCTFTAGGVAAMGGPDYFEEFRGTYFSKQSAADAIKKRGYGSLYGLLVKKFGQPSVRAAFGCVLYTITIDGPTIGLCGDGRGIFVSQCGLIELPLHNIMVFQWAAC